MTVINSVVRGWISNNPYSAAHYQYILYKGGRVHFTIADCFKQMSIITSGLPTAVVQRKLTLFKKLLTSALKEVENTEEGYTEFTLKINNEANIVTSVSIDDEGIEVNFTKTVIVTDKNYKHVSKVKLHTDSIVDA